MRRGGVVKVLPYLFDLFGETLPEKMCELSSCNAGRKRIDFGFTRQRVCNREQLFASLSCWYLCAEVMGLPFRTKRVITSFFCVKISLCTIKPDFRQARSALRRSLVAARISAVNEGVIFFLF